ncbi:MAG: efflux RND transporter periplasmic adaptor subunit [Chitinispirillaceae bacterium]|nr:efflux RND transporter periplasmic adaptor subunit [Chitinispirillaceae bacterium]
MKTAVTCAIILPVLFATECGKRKDTLAYTEQHTVGIVDLKDVVVQTGEVQPVIKVDIKSEASGKIETINVREGQKVAKGDLLISIDPSRLTFRRKALDLAVKKARLDLSVAERNLNDATKLASSGTVSEKQLFDLTALREQADITLQQQLLELSDIADQLSKTRVTSPMDGVVITLDVEEGEIAVSATSGFQGGTPLATIADTKTLEVVSRIGEADYIHLHTGQKVILRPEATEGTFTTGSINFIALSAKKEKSDELGTFEVRVAIDSLIPGIVPGINITTEFVIMEKKGVLGIPNHFVNKTEKGFEAVRLLRDTPGTQSTEIVPITVGGTDYKHYEILSGLKKGEVVMFRDTTAQAGPGKGN